MDIVDKIVKAYCQHLDNKVEHYAKIFKFDVGPDGHTSYNNEGDAFKHCFMQAELSIFLGQTIAKKIGDMHEQNNKYNTPQEMNMDLWNNREGREIGKEVQIADDTWLLHMTETYNSIAAKIVERMQAGRLITDLNDPRQFDS